MRLQFLMIGIIFAIIFIFSLCKVFSKDINKRGLVINLIIINFIILFAVINIWRFIDYYSPHQWIEITLPIKGGKSGNIKSVEFCLPKGDYAMFLEPEGDTVNKDGGRKIHYRIEIPNQDFVIDKEKIVDFSRGIDYIPMDTFVINKDKSRGILSVEVIESNDEFSFKLVLSTHRYL